MASVVHAAASSDTSYMYQQHSVFPFVKWNLDQLTACKPSQLYGSFSSPTNVNQSLVSRYNITPYDAANGSVITEYPSVNHGFFSTQDIRIAHALEKLARVSMSAPKTFRALS